MTLRISTRGMHEAAIAQIQARQVSLSKSQTQLASGQRVSTPADDPIAATRILDIERMQAQVEQYDKNSTYATNRLGVTEQALSDLGDLLQRIRQLAVQANSGTLDDASLSSIAAELRTRSQELQDIANRRDTSGEYLFAGYSTQGQPFTRGAAGVGYAGDQGTRSLQVSATQRITDGLSGDQVFMGVKQGNGRFVTALGAHAGTGSVDLGEVVNAAAWQAAPQPREFTVRFTAPDAWEVLDASGNPLQDGGAPVSGTYQSGGTIEFLGIRLTVSGAPAVGDTIAVTPAGRESLFQTVDDLIGALGAGTATPESRARFTTAINQALGQLSQGLDHVTDLRAEVGARLSALDSATSARSDLQYELSGSLSELRDLDYAEAISRMNQQLVGLQAAQTAYGRIAQLSLFSYL
ncbi:MAG: flagellar hook-associated protein FlgL [Steroidobacteraceae bacterium]